VSGAVSRRRAAGRQAEALAVAGARGIARAPPGPLGCSGHRGGGGLCGVGVAGGGVCPGRVVRVRAAGGARAGDGCGDSAGPVGNHAGDRDAGVCQSYPVRGQGGGTLTWLPSAGRVIRQGQVLYKTGNGSPVVLLYGSVPRVADPG